jgi:hypothetical protein
MDLEGIVRAIGRITLASGLRYWAPEMTVDAGSCPERAICQVYRGSEPWEGHRH